MIQGLQAAVCPERVKRLLLVTHDVAFAKLMCNRLLIMSDGMEMVECGGMLCKNVKAGGVSHASFLFTGPNVCII